MSDAVVNGLAGAGGGIIAQLLTYPLQAVNTRQQTQRRAKQLSQPPPEEPPCAGRQPQDSVGTAQELWNILQQEGVGGLYRGLSPSLVGTTCSQGVYYYFYQLFRDQAEARARRKGRGSVSMLASLLVASLAGCANVLLTNPIWVIVTRMQTQSQVQTLPWVPKDGEEAGCGGRGGAGALCVVRDLGPAHSLLRHSPGNLCRWEVQMRDLYEEAGILGFWKGLFPTLVMVTNPALQFMIYETLLAKTTAKRPPGKGVSAGETFCMGAVAKLGATVTTYPLLVVKSRLQARQDIASMRYTGTLDAILKMIRYEGVSGFYRGMSTKIVQSVFAAAVLFMTKEELVRLARALVDRNQKARSVLRKVV